ncbi:MAG: ABC transporter ATP-binding protein [Anaerolineae bacterium]
MSQVIKVHKVGKWFRLYHKGRPTTIQEALTKRMRGLRPREAKWALRDINFSVRQGKMTGIIGANGSGKSTMLRLLGGVLRPDEGQILTKGRIGGLLELGAGFHHDLTGRENIFVNGIVSGLTRSDVAHRFDEIVAFSELEDDIDYPLRTYSSGMQIRLGFAVAAYSDPEILLIDEVLSVGDVSFQKKCFDRIRQFREEGRTIVFVTHSLDQVQQFCDEAIWINKGSLVDRGKPDQIVSDYLNKMAEN